MKNYLPLNEEKGDLDIPEYDMDINGIGLCNLALILCLMRRVEDISNQIKINYHFIDDTRDKVKYLTSLMDIRVNIPEEIEKQFGKMKKEIVVKNVLKVP